MSKVKDLLLGCRQVRIFGHGLGSFVRWFVVAFGASFFGLAILYLFVDCMKLPLWLGSILCAEIGTLLRFFLNERFVFQPSGNLWSRIVKYHLANAGGFVIWYLTTNLVARWGAHYLLSALAGMFASMMWSVLTNFTWVWKPSLRGKPTVDLDESP